jgi:hypothetical protein
MAEKAPFSYLGQERLVQRNAPRLRAANRERCHSEAQRVAPSHECGARGRAHLLHIIVGQFQAGVGHAVNVRRHDSAAKDLVHGAVGSAVVVAEVIDAEVLRVAARTCVAPRVAQRQSPQRSAMYVPLLLAK